MTAIIVNDDLGTVAAIPVAVCDHGVALADECKECLYPTEENTFHRRLLMDKPILPKSYVGAWCRHGEGDVHVYACPTAVVIGTNKNYKDKIEFSDIALYVEDTGGVTLQYADDNGQPKFCKVSDDTWKTSILAMLNDLKAKAVKEQSDPGI